MQLLITIGQIKTSEPREKLYRYAKEAGAEMPTVVSPRAYLSRHAKVGSGTTVMHEAIVNCSAEIGENCIINTKALVEHDAKIGNHTHIATGAFVNGGAQIGQRCFIGSGAVIHNDIDIGDGCLIGAGTIVQTRPTRRHGVEKSASSNRHGDMTESQSDKVLDHCRSRREP